MPLSIQDQPSPYSDQYSVISPQTAVLENREMNETRSSYVSYGPIRIRVCRRPAPTLATGRRPKNLILSGDDAIKREKRREKNRVAAQRLKEKRRSIEVRLQGELEFLEKEHSNLQYLLHELRYRKQQLEGALNHRFYTDTINDLLLMDSNKPNFIFDLTTNDFNVLSSSVSDLSDLNNHFDSPPDSY